MTTRRRALVVALVLAVTVAMASMILAARRQERGGAARALGQLPTGYRYVRMEADEASATAELFRDRYEAADVAVTLVETPQDRSPLGVTVVAFVLREPPDPTRLAAQLERDVPLVDPMPKMLAGQPVLSHEADATLASADLWVHGRLAIVAYAATTAEVDGVLAGLLDSGAWRRVAAA